MFIKVKGRYRGHDYSEINLIRSEDISYVKNNVIVFKKKLDRIDFKCDAGGEEIYELIAANRRGMPTVEDVIKDSIYKAKLVVK